MLKAIGKKKIHFYAENLSLSKPVKEVYLILCMSVYLCLVVTCWERVDLLALICGVQL